MMHASTKRQEDFKISLDAFHGPLDLLFYLIRRAEVDIHDIPIAAITDQYFQVLRQVDDADVELAGEFLVMAATLVEIKSRTLAPVTEQAESDSGPEGKPGETTDPREALVQQLLAYQRYRVASEELDAHRLEFLQRFPLKPSRLGHPVMQDDDEVVLEIEDAHVMDLADAYERIASAIDFSRLGEHHVEYDETPIELHEEDLLDRLSRSSDRKLVLQDAFSGQNRGDRIGMFMAMLELARMRRIRVHQEAVDDDIVIEQVDDPNAIVVETDLINRDAAHADHD